MGTFGAIEPDTTITVTTSLVVSKLIRFADRDVDFSPLSV